MESCRELKENNPYLFNSWRSILYTEKGRKAGVVDKVNLENIIYIQELLNCYLHINSKIGNPTENSI